MRYLLLAILLLLGPAPVFAQDGGSVAALCDGDAERCRDLAGEIARLELLHRIDKTQGRPGALVCSPDNAALMMPLCEVSERLLITTALIEVAPDIDWGDWNWVDHCWMPLGCDDEIVIPEVEEPDPPPPEAVCEIIDRGSGMPIWLCWAPGTFTRDPPPPPSPPPPPPPPELVRHLEDRAVRLDAAGMLKEELTQMLQAVDEEIRVLTP